MKTQRELLELVINAERSDDFEAGSDLYYAAYAWENYGSACRDNSFGDLVELGKELEEEGGLP